MTTMRQREANLLNSRRSSGPRSAVGKAKASRNALKHGILGTHLLLADESADEFRLLLDGLQASLSPVGDLEVVLVERIAVTVWRQRRLVRAETAHVELNRRLDIKSNRHQVERALGMTYPEEIEDRHLRLVDDIEAEAIEHCNALCMEHIVAIDVIRAGDLTQFAKLAPQLHAALEAEAKARDLSVPVFLTQFEGGLHGWATLKLAESSMDIQAHARRTLILQIADLVKSNLSLPANHELFSRYQTALDNELYRAIRALREAQEWRLKTLDNPVQEVKRIRA
ncbi:hypothetical protein ACNRD9_06690 [Ralstonia pseudosolanacearum]|uniref:hypothetical protein n=2 Tax=Ralstonia pseudosolanacearum TaxID=1310165 RepID=UPI001268E741|nr:hypothetical protein [Ralstonia pseudosolanacearum]MCK4150382.1 hypothetical protein [Ralstonia pseudosolanacearum]BCL86238.1 hypothetical protein MAFF211471_13210 [Ralstonia solanacearum]BCM98787.1 hypothetical protein RPSA_13240 [Ralstonia solanacearum]